MLIRHFIEAFKTFAIFQVLYLSYERTKIPSFSICFELIFKDFCYFSDILSCHFTFSCKVLVKGARHSRKRFKTTQYCYCLFFGEHNFFPFLHICISYAGLLQSYGRKVKLQIFCRSNLIGSNLIDEIHRKSNGINGKFGTSGLVIV